ncbi:MAG: PSD1 domain-containing protein [Planctomycetaceae bacterium]|nr:PSD1 domain-containing protein [Planctomycetaceae bacterium]
MRCSRLRVLLLTFLTLGAMSFDPAASPAEDALDFVRDIRPLLETRCFECHGSDTREAGLRLDRKEPALAGGDTGKVILPGDVDGSPLIERVTSDDPEKVMPPDAEPLTAEEVAKLKAWIEAGAIWPDGVDGPKEVPDHWAYQPVKRLDPPNVEHADLVVNPIDSFVLARLEEKEIEPSEVADRYTLIKRLYYDLLGLPPEPEAVEAFVNDESPDAYEQLVDELLRSPHFGERWGRHWLDMARYADSDGYEKDNPRYNAWKYRDWVIDAVNDDMPFDQFTIQQLAGDLLTEPTQDQLLATAFNRQTLTNTEGGTDQEQWRVEAVFDRVETLGTAWLGLTVGCARCHSHKYDQISQREYYQLFAFFNNGDEVNTTVPSSDQALQQYVEDKAEFDRKLAEKRQPLVEAKEALRPTYPEWEAAQQARIADAAATPIEFVPLDVKSVNSEKGATLTKQDDGSVLASGELPDKDVYELTIAVDQPITGLKLEVLADESLPLKGPGRAPNGNFVLSEIQASLAPAEGTEAEPEKLSFVAARANHSQDGYPVIDAITRADGKKGWAIREKQSEDHEALFAFAAPIATDEAGPRTLTVRLVQQYDRSIHTIGRFRLSGMTGIDPDLLGYPENIRKHLAVNPDERTDEQKNQLFEYFASLDPQVRDLHAQVDKFQKAAPFNPEMAVRVIKQRTQDPRQTHVLKRGDFLQPLGPVEPTTLEILQDFTLRDETSSGDRLDLAMWLVAEDNPLTARVAVNHIWSHLFGHGLVKTVNDFGVRGEAPTHPELLDWLASEFMRLGWSRKQFIKTIVLSHTYRQSSAHRPELAEVDPTNMLLSRQNRFRVEAEIVRDLTLAASGLLERRIGGPSVFPPLPPGIAELSYANNFKWGNSVWNDREDKPHGVSPKDDIYRRGMYTFFKRTAAHPTLVAFDCPDANVTCVERRTSNTPLQALTTLNNDVFVTAARALALRVIEEVNTNDAERLDRMFRLCVARPPSNDELNSLLDLLSEARSYYGEHADEAESFAGETLPPDTSTSEMAAWVATSRIVMNLDEFITRE